MTPRSTAGLPRGSSSRTGAPIDTGAASRAHTIAVLAFEGMSLFHLSVPCLVFGEDRRESGVPRYKLLVCAEQPGLLKTSSGCAIEARYGLDRLRAAGTVIVPTWPDPARRPTPKLLGALKRAHARGTRMVGLCLGAFVLAEAGLLDGRPATTHWHWAELFAQRFPRVRLDPEVLYIDDGDVLTSAGTAAGIDCCLHVLRASLGAEVANRVARRLVVAPHRQGGQAQFIEQPLPVHPGADRLSRTLDWAGRHLAEPLGVDALAARALMSRRSFTRHFRAATGTTVQQWVVAQRVALARRLLETTDLAVEQVAVRAGFGSSLSLRQHFALSLRTTPTHYRREFRGAGRDEPLSA